MTDINHVVIIGRLVRDGELSYLTSGTAVLKISIAVNESRKGADGWTDYPNYFDVTIWGKTAENLKQFLSKGKQIAVSGHLQQQRWEKEGQKNSKVVIIADNVELCGGKSDGGQRAPAPQNNEAESQTEEFPEDIPF